MRLFDRSLWMFLLIGAGNTLMSFAIMQGMYALGWGGYWFSSAIAFAVTSVISYFLNKRFSFHNEDSLMRTAWRFALVIAVCYLIAYTVARPATGWLLTKLLPQDALPLGVDQIAMLTGQAIFTGLNYLGQRHFAFKQTGER